MVSSILRHKIIIKRKTTTNNSGIVSNSWSNFLTLKSGVKFLSGSELEYANKQTGNKIKVRFQIRYNDLITESDMVEYNGNKFNITFIQPMKENNSTFLYAELDK